MSRAWEPNGPAVLQICQLLEEVQKPGSNQSQVLQQLAQYSSNTEFNNYLAYILSQGHSLSAEVRQSAGLLLKNNLKQQYAALTPEHAAYIKAALLSVLPCPIKPLRRTAGTIVTTIVGAGGLEAWPDLVSGTVASLQSGDENALDGTLDMLYKVVEDHPQKVDARMPGGARATTILVPALLALFRSPHVLARRLSLAILNMMAGDMPEGLADGLDTYVQGLFALAHDPAPAVKKEVCRGLVQLLAIRPELLLPNIGPIIDYMLVANQDADPAVALEACEFWQAYCEAELEPELIRAVLPKLVPVLMNNMVYDEFDDEVADAEAAETSTSQQQDRDQDLKPRFHKGHEHAGGGGEEGEEEDGDDDDGEVRAWNNRKCSAASLDMLANVFGDELLPVLLPIVQQRLQDPDWRARESAILGLGAVSEGCHQGLLPSLESIVNMLLPMLNDPRPMVRIITCWSLGRYNHWMLTTDPHEQLLQPPQPPQQQPARPQHPLFDTALTHVLPRLLDHNKHVQEAACSALAEMEESASDATSGFALVPHLQVILQTLAVASTRYTRKNLFNMYDAVMTLCTALSVPLRDPQLAPQLVQLITTIIMPPLFQRWQAAAPTDKDLLPLMECFTAVAGALRSHFEPIAPAVFEKALQAVHIQLQTRQALSQSPAPSTSAGGQQQQRPPQYEPLFISCGLDVISGMVQGLGPSIQPLASGSQLMELVLLCCQDETADIRQSAFALTGDLAKAATSVVQPHVAAIVTLALKNLEPAVLREEDNMLACNNACWAVGELCSKLQPELLQPLAQQIGEAVALVLLGSVRVTRGLLSNAAITLGRLGRCAGEQLAPHLHVYAAAWFSALRNVRDDYEKEEAFLGLCRLVRLNPQAAVGAFPALAGAVTSWRRIECEGLRNELAQIMHMFRDSLSGSGQWQGLMGTLEPQVRDKLVAMCSL